MYPHSPVGIPPQAPIIISLHTCLLQETMTPAPCSQHPRDALICSQPLLNAHTMNRVQPSSQTQEHRCTRKAACAGSDHSSYPRNISATCRSAARMPPAGHAFGGLQEVLQLCLWNMPGRGMKVEGRLQYGLKDRTRGGSEVSRCWLLFLRQPQLPAEFHDSGNYCLSYHLALICAKSGGI